MRGAKVAFGIIVPDARARAAAALRGRFDAARLLARELLVVGAAFARLPAGSFLALAVLALPRTCCTCRECFRSRVSAWGARAAVVACSFFARPVVVGVLGMMFLSLALATVPKQEPRHLCRVHGKHLLISRFHIRFAAAPRAHGSCRKGAAHLTWSHHATRNVPESHVMTTRLVGLRSRRRVRRLTTTQIRRNLSTRACAIT